MKSPYYYNKNLKLVVLSLLVPWFVLLANRVLSQNWDVVRTGIGKDIGNFGFSQLHFPDANNGWAVSFQDPWGEPVEVTLIHTKDGGITWDEKILRHEELLGIDYKPRAVYFLNDYEGWIGGVNNLGHTTDGGESWQMIKVGYEGKPQAHAQGSWREIDLVISRIYFVSSNEGWVAGHGQVFSDYYGSFILHTSNGGKSWEAQVPVSGVNPGAFTALDFIHAGEGWAGGWEGVRGVMMHTQSGINWENLPDLPDTILDICFTDSQNGWALTHISWTPSYIHHTADGGRTWVEQSVPESAIDRLQDGLLYALDFANDHEGWAVGSHGVILHTRDSGKHWTLQESRMSVTLVDVQCVADNGVFVLGNDGTILKLNMGGSASLNAEGKIHTTWAELKNGSVSLLVY